MNTYELFSDGRIKLGKDSAASVADSILCEIILSTDSSEGGAPIEFCALTDADFSRLTAGFEKPEKYNNESYIVEISDTVRVYYTSDITKLYALYALKRLYERDGICRGIVYNRPRLEFRCFRSYLPPKDGIDEFLRFIDMLIAFGHNTIMLEIGGAMEYKRHPEINEGWVDYCKIFEEFNGKTEWVQRSAWYPKNAIHCDNAGGKFLTYEELAKIVNYCRERNFEIIPEVPSLSHTDYLLYNHPELAELDNDHLPNNACPQNEDYYKLIFDVLDEVVEVFKPTRVNICHDEAYVFGYCPRCRGKDASVLFATHMTRLHDHLAEMGVRTMIWGDGVLPMEHGGNAGFHRRYEWDGKRIVNIEGEKYEVHNFKYHSIKDYEEAMKTKERVDGLYVPPKKNSINLIPRDIEMIDWSWSLYNSSEILNEYGFYHVYGNFSAYSMRDFNKRIKEGIKGISFSNWGRTDFEALQRTNSLFAIGYNSLAVWGGGFESEAVLDNTFIAADEVYRYINYDKLHTKHLKIVHTTDAFLAHPFFYDGYVIVKEDFRIGEYEIEFADGEKAEIPIYWGHNIGNRSVIWDKKVQLDMEEGAVTKHLYEPIGEAKPILDGKHSYYEFVIPVEKEVRAVSLRVKDGYNVELRSCEIC